MATEANPDPHQITTVPPIKELHCCMGLNACKGHDRIGTNDCAGQGECATVNHACHTLNNCRDQGGCGLYGTTEEQAVPGVNDCAWQGSCASPINAERFIVSGQLNSNPNHDPDELPDNSFAGESVWRRARQVFEEKMTKLGREVGPPPEAAYQKVKTNNGDKVLEIDLACGPSHTYISTAKTAEGNPAFPGFASCGASGMSGGGSCG